MRHPALACGVLVAIVGCTGSSDREGARTSASPSPASTETRKNLLERVDEAAVAQIYADQFATLALREKTLIWHLTQAAIAGRDIFYDQQHRNGLEMRGVLEAILRHAAGIEPAVLSEIQRYTKLFWINSGPYNNLTSRKFVLKTSPAALIAAAKVAAANGAVFPTAPGESLESLLARLQPMFFDPDVDPVVTNKTPGAGRDILATSATNLYLGVTMSDVASFRERYALNSRLVKRDGRLVEEVYRVNGRYAKEITEIIRHLEAAIPFATDPTANALRALIQWYRTGEDTDRINYDIAWVNDKNSPVDTINGFIEQYLDPRGVKGAWESVVFYVNREKTDRIRRFADNAQWFEDHMPYDAKYRKPNVRGVVANAIDVIVETGEAGPVSAVGINLPNDETIREQHGSKSVSLSNVLDAANNAVPESMRREFAWSADEAARTEKFSSIFGELLTNMHEVIGHASGRQAEGFAGTPQAAIGEYFSALEEGRADLVALYFLADPKLAELGLVSAANQDTIALAQYESYTRNALILLRRVRQGTQVEEDHDRNRQMIVRWLMANTRAIEQRTRDNKTYLVVVDPKAFRAGVGRLLAEVQRIKSEGDRAAAKALMEQYAIHFETKLRDEIVARVDALKLPSYNGYVMPTLTPVTDASGSITDVTISYPMDLTTQMLEYSRIKQ